MNELLIYLLSISSVSTIAIWLGKLIITKSFDLGIEKYKAELTKEIEEYRSQLLRISSEHQIKFTKLHDERAIKIKVLYTEIVELEGNLINSTTFAQGSDYPTDHKRDEAALSSIRTLIHNLDLERIYFSENTVSKIEEIIKESWEIYFTMTKARREATRHDEDIKADRTTQKPYTSETDLWDKAYSRTQNEFKILKDELANEFRALLGI